MKRRTLLGSIAAALCFWKTDAQAAPPKPAKGFHPAACGEPMLFSDGQRLVYVVPDIDGEGTWYRLAVVCTPLICDGVAFDWNFDRGNAYRVVWKAVSETNPHLIPVVVEASSLLVHEDHEFDRGSCSRNRYILASSMDRYNRSYAAAERKFRT